MEETKSAKVTQKAEKKLQPMSKFVDELLLKGGKVDDIYSKANAEAKKRKVTWGTKKAHIVGHIRFRIRHDKMPITLKDGVVSAA